MNDKIKHKTREPSPEFLADTKPAFIPRVRGKKDRAWYRPDESDQVEPAPTTQTELVTAEGALRTDSPAQLASPEDHPRTPASANPKKKAEVSQAAANTAVSSPGHTKLAHEPTKSVNVRKGAATADRRPLTAGSQLAHSSTEVHGLTAHLYGERAQVLISRSQSPIPHEYLFRQIVMFEMSDHDSTLEFGTLCLSRTGLEQLFGMSEAGVKKAKREMESLRLIETVSIGTRGAPTVFRVFSPYLLAT